MRTPAQYRHEQKSMAYSLLLLFNLCLVILQLWLFVSVLEDMQRGRYSVAMPAAGLSALCLGVNVLFLKSLYNLEDKP